jgi:hypothetical protein
MRSRIVDDAIVALDDYDRKATYLRENLRIDGMGQNYGRYFRDNQDGMRAKSCGICPSFFVLYLTIMTSILSLITPPWVLKPRSEASASGIIKAY